MAGERWLWQVYVGYYRCTLVMASIRCDMPRVRCAWSSSPQTFLSGPSQERSLWRPETARHGRFMIGWHVRMMTHDRLDRVTTGRQKLLGGGGTKKTLTERTCYRCSKRCGSGGIKIRAERRLKLIAILHLAPKKGIELEKETKK